MSMPGNFKSQLRFWGGHAVICAAPSFTLALAGGIDTNPALAGMSAGVVVWVLIYAFLTSRNFFREWVAGFPARAIELGAKIRSLVALLGVTLFFVVGVMPRPIEWLRISILAEFYAGFVSIQFVNWITGWNSGGFRTLTDWTACGYTFLVTLSVGFLLSFTLALAVLMGAALLYFKAQRKAQPA